jgi:hypothetical protein
MLLLLLVFTACAAALAGASLSLRVLLDGSALEVFTSTGETLTTRVYRGHPPSTNTSTSNITTTNTSSSTSTSCTAYAPPSTATVAAAAAGTSPLTTTSSSTALSSSSCKDMLHPTSFDDVDPSGISLFAVGAAVRVRRIDVWEMGCCIAELDDASWLDDVIYVHPQHQADDADQDRVLRQAARSTASSGSVSSSALLVEHATAMSAVPADEGEVAAAAAAEVHDGVLPQAVSAVAAAAPCAADDVQRQQVVTECEQAQVQTAFLHELNINIV